MSPLYFFALSLEGFLWQWAESKVRVVCFQNKPAVFCITFRSCWSKTAGYWAMKWLNQIKIVTDREPWKVGKFRITAAAAGRHQGHGQTAKLPQNDGIVYWGGRWGWRRRWFMGWIGTFSFLLFELKQTGRLKRDEIIAPQQSCAL